MVFYNLVTVSFFSVLPDSVWVSNLSSSGWPSVSGTMKVNGMASRDNVEQIMYGAISLVVPCKWWNQNNIIINHSMWSVQNDKDAIMVQVKIDSN